MTEQEQPAKRPGTGTVNAGAVCMLIGMGLMYLSLWTVLLYLPLFLAAFILGIVAISQGRHGSGTLLLLSSLVFPFFLFIGLGATRMKDISDNIAAAPPPENVDQMAIVDFACSGEGSYSWVSGKVRNSGNGKIALPKLSATFMAKDGSLIDTSTGYADTTPLLPGQTSTFKIYGPHNQRVATCSVSPN
jgi:hypothetical protein